MTRLRELLRTTTVRLTALFILIFVVFAVGLLGLVFWQTSIQLQQQQTQQIDRETHAIRKLDDEGGFRATVVAISQLASQPGPGIYYLADPTGQMIVGNVNDLPPEVIAQPGTYSFNYDRPQGIEGEDAELQPRQGTALVRSEQLSSGLIVVVGRDIVERRGFTAIVLQWFAIGAGGILLFSLIAGVVTAVRVLRRMETITTTSNKIMAGDLSERVPVTKRNDEFDALATNLNAMLDRIEQLMQGMKEVTDNVAHDLKTPLTRMRNKAESALRDSQDEAARKEALATTIEESDKLIKTFNALLMIARAEAGTPSGALSEIDLSAVVADVAELYGPLAEDEGLTLDTDIAMGIKLNGNRELLGQALVNLIENALKYYEPIEGKAGRIVVGLKAERGRVLVTVADNGPGIPEADRGRVVERFVRLEESRTEPGSGLGLSLVAAVAKLHKGELRLEDNAPGLRAVIDLPA
ncbi:MAG: sensor histidine kinase [Devosia sp.]